MMDGIRPNERRIFQRKTTLSSDMLWRLLPVIQHQGLGLGSFQLGFLKNYAVMIDDDVACLLGDE